MTPFATPAYFALLAVLALPILVLRARGRDVRLWIVAACAVMLIAQFSASTPALISLGIFAALQAAAILGFRALTRVAAPNSPPRRWGLWAAVAVILLPLIACRVLPFLTKSVTFGFLGISYVTFRSLDVVIGLNDGLIAALDIGQLFAFLFFFPPLSSGPIDRYRRFGKDWEATADRARLAPDVDGAVQHIFRGLLYKFILAFLVKTYWMDPAAHQPGAIGLVSYMYAYSAFLFFDFAGYSAFAVGASCLFGIRTPENFHLPFLAPNIRDFWTRWHISLSTWFRDHVYMRFVMTAMKRRWFKTPRAASYGAYVVTFGLMGLWHGFAANFLIYGLYHAALLIGYDRFSVWNKEHQWLKPGRLGRAAGTFVTVNAVCFGFLIFSGHLTPATVTEKPSLKDGLHAHRPGITSVVHDRASFVFADAPQKIAAA